MNSAASLHMKQVLHNQHVPGEVAWYTAIYTSTHIAGHLAHISFNMNTFVMKSKVEQSNVSCKLNALLASCSTASTYWC